MPQMLVTKHMNGSRIISSPYWLLIPDVPRSCWVAFRKTSVRPMHVLLHSRGWTLTIADGWQLNSRLSASTTEYVGPLMLWQLQTVAEIPNAVLLPTKTRSQERRNAK